MGVDERGALLLFILPTMYDNVHYTIARYRGGYPSLDACVTDPGTLVPVWERFPYTL